MTPAKLASFGANAVPGSPTRKVAFGSSETPASLTRGTDSVTVVGNHGQDGDPKRDESRLGTHAHATGTAAGVAHHSSIPSFHHSSTIPGARAEEQWVRDKARRRWAVGGVIVRNKANLGEFHVGPGRGRPRRGLIARNEPNLWPSGRYAAKPSASYRRLALAAATRSGAPVGTDSAKRSQSGRVSSGRGASSGAFRLRTSNFKLPNSTVRLPLNGMDRRSGLW